MSRHLLSRTAICLTLFLSTGSTHFAHGADGQPAAAPAARLALQLNRGISLDRQFRQIPPEPIMRFTREDIRLIRSSGFEFVKLIVNPEPLMNGVHLDTQKREYLRDVRTAFETYNIGWAYWSYNETLTMMTTQRQPFGPAAKQTPDPDLLRALLDCP